MIEPATGRLAGHSTVAPSVTPVVLVSRGARRRSSGRYVFMLPADSAALLTF